MSPEAIGHLQSQQLLQPDDLKDNRQSADITRAIDMLNKVSQLNERYEAAIHLPTVRTPSQLKAAYEPLLDSDGVEVMEKVIGHSMHLPYLNFQSKLKLKLVR